MLVRERLALVARRVAVERLLPVERVLLVERPLVERVPVERLLLVERLRVEAVLRRAVLRLVLRLLFWVAIGGESLLRDVL